jgi:hypothetical protein
MNGMKGPRRSARPARIALATLLGGDIDGAWWPHTASVAGELLELIELCIDRRNPCGNRAFASPIPTRIPWAC